MLEVFRRKRVVSFTAQWPRFPAVAAMVCLGVLDRGVLTVSCWSDPSMAKQIVTLLTDDLDGSEADRTVEFGLDGVNYTIDLSEKNAGKLRKALQVYVSAG